MGLVKFSPLVSAVSGKVGGVVFSRTVGGSSVRSWSKGTNPNAPGQLIQRSRLSQLSTAYGQLTPAQRQSFVDAANLAEHKVTNRLGESVNLTGPQFYNKVNLLLLSAGLPLITEYSGYWEAPMFKTTFATYNVTNPNSPSLNIGFTYAPGWDPASHSGKWCIKISRPTPPGRKSQSFRNLASFAPDSPEPIISGQAVFIPIPTTLILNTLGVQPPGYKFNVQVMALSATHPWDQSVGEVPSETTTTT